MRFLNLDLDFSLSNVAYFRPDKVRLSSTDYVPWSEAKVRMVD